MNSFSGGTMDETSYYWWYAYAPFEPGEHNRPHMGQVIRYYRELRGWAIKDLAKALQITEHHVYEIESGSSMPESIERRTILAKLLKIPPALMGLSIIVSTDQGTSLNDESEITGIIRVIDAQRMAAYEDLLFMSWELYYMGNLQFATRNIDQWIRVLSHAAKEARGIERDQVLALLCRFNQLSCTAARDRKDTGQAYHEGKKAIDIALHLENAELIASAYYRRMRVYLQEEEYDKAAQDVEVALHYVDVVRDPLKATLYRAAAETFAPIAGEDRQLQKQCLMYLDSASRIIRKGNLEPDGSFLKPDISSVQIERAATLAQFHRSKDAHNALILAHEQISPGNIRRRKDLLLAEAETYLSENELGECCEMILESLKLTQATSSRSNETWMLSLYRQLQQRDANNPLVCRLGMELGVD
jgi:transcriptional regulator with XRE-family HTH domain